MIPNEMTLARAFRDVGIEQDKAEGLAQIIFDAIRDNTATKADLRDAVHQLKADLRDTVHQLTIRGIGALISSLGILFWALHQWPPHV